MFTINTLLPTALFLNLALCSVIILIGRCEIFNTMIAWYSGQCSYFTILKTPPRALRYPQGVFNVLLCHLVFLEDSQASMGHELSQHLVPCPSPPNDHQISMAWVKTDTRLCPASDESAAVGTFRFVDHDFLQSTDADVETVPSSQNAKLPASPLLRTVSTCTPKTLFQSQSLKRIPTTTPTKFLALHT